MTWEERQPQFSRSELSELASEQILGPELLALVFAHVDAGQDPKQAEPNRLVEALLSKESESGLREQALAMARQDRSFLLVRAEDLAVSRGGCVQVMDQKLVRAVLQHFGKWSDEGYVDWPRRNQYNGASNRPVEDPGQLKQEFLDLLANERPTWLALAQSESASVRDEVQQRIGRPIEPERFALQLVERRLSRLCGELDPFLDSEHQRWQEELVARQKAEHEQKIKEAWGEFFDDPAPLLGWGEEAVAAAEENAPEPPSLPVRPRGVSPELGDAGLGRD